MPSKSAGNILSFGKNKSKPSGEVAIKISALEELGAQVMVA